MEVGFIKENSYKSDRLKAYQSITTHTHLCREVEVEDVKAQENLVGYCHKFNISALGVGSPWSVDFLKLAKHHEKSRDLYYSSSNSNQDLLKTEEVTSVIQSLKHQCPSTYFYLDSETPKMRHGHMWWFGYNYDQPFWHDYDQDQHVSFWHNDNKSIINSVTSLPHSRRTYRKVLQQQRNSGALGIWAHPTSWWMDGQRFITNIAAESYLHYLIDGYLDGLTIQGYKPYHESYQNLWFSFLDKGGIVPGFSETDHCFGAKNYSDSGASAGISTYMKLPHNFTLADIKSAAKKGNCFASSGPRLTLEIDDKYNIGEVIAEFKAKMTLKVHYASSEGGGQGNNLQIIGKGGVVLYCLDQAVEGEYHFTLTNIQDGDYVLARIWEADLANHHHTGHAITNPVYFKKSKLMNPLNFSNLELLLSDRIRGASLSVYSRNDEILETLEVSERKINLQCPSDGLIKLDFPNGAKENYEVLYENKVIQRYLTHICEGHFLREHKGLSAGEVPSSVMTGAHHELVQAISYPVINID